MKISINLENRDNNPHRNITPGWCVDFPPKNFQLGRRILSVFQRIQKTLYVGIKDLNIDKALICDKDNLFVIQYGNELFGQASFPVKFNLSQEQTPFQFSIDTSKIIDCKEKQQANRKKYNINVTLSIQNESHKCIREENIDIEVEFIELSIEPSINILFDSLPNGNLQYDSSLGEIEVGKLKCRYNKKWEYTPSINLTSSLQLFQDGKLLTNVLKIYRGSHLQKDISIKDRDEVNESYVLKIDLSKLKNPSFPSTMTIKNSASYSLSCSPDIHHPLFDNDEGAFDEKKDFLLIPDPHGTELKVKYSFSNEDKVAINEGESNLQQIEFRAGSPMGGRLRIFFQNVATDTSNPEAGVFIKHMIVSSEIADARLIDKKGNNLSAQHVIDVSGDHKDKMTGPDGCFIPNGRKAIRNLDIDFMPEKIDELKETSSYNFRIITTLRFDYWENKSGASLSEFDINKKTYRHCFVWNLFQRPNKEWLCVDYGTSAIVCMYDKKIIDMKKRKTEIIKHDDIYKKLLEDEFEQGTKYLSSDIVFHQQPNANPKVSSLCSEQAALSQYSDLAICLSPTTKMVVTDVLHQIPCLKLLMGHYCLPQPEGYHDLNIKYKRLDENGAISEVDADVALEHEEKNAILKVDNVFLEAYTTLFRYFILPSMTNVNKVNKLILTYPNTYTPLHIKTLEAIARKVFPNIRPGYLCFVGESDAVAAYYMNHWNDYHSNAEDIKRDETVLVYDMGAGTLDITVFNKKYRDGVFKIEILGKIGTTKAGNYLDALIAKILAKKKLIRETYVRLNRGASQEISENKTSLKIAIKNIKNQLSQPPNTQITIQHGNSVKISTTVGTIIESSEFKQYISQITEGIVGKMMSYLTDKESRNIDTVIMSGRACKLKAIQDSLNSVFNGQSGSLKSNIIMLDDPVNVNSAENSERQKSSVCEGAVAYCNLYQRETSEVQIKSKRLYANYGITYKSTEKRVYMELINSSQMPDNNNVETIIFESQNVNDLGSAEGITLIQSYMTREDTLAALNSFDKGDLDDSMIEYISEMMYIDKEDYDNADSIEVRLELDKNNNISLLINGNPTTKHTPKGLSLESEVTKMSLWPVAIE